jgi:hypothetical protein
MLRPQQTNGRNAPCGILNQQKAGRSENHPVLQHSASSLPSMNQTTAIDTDRRRQRLRLPK